MSLISKDLVNKLKIQKLYEIENISNPIFQLSVKKFQLSNL
jgi:hypothetical protein